MIDQRIKARVLKVEGAVCTLGVYVEGAWRRLDARTTVALEVGSWIEGSLAVPGDGSMVQLRLEVVTARTRTEGDARRPGLDYEA